MKETDIYCRKEARKRIRDSGLSPEKAHIISEYVNDVVKEGLKKCQRCMDTE